MSENKTCNASESQFPVRNPDLGFSPYNIDAPNPGSRLDTRHWTPDSSTRINTQESRLKPPESGLQTPYSIFNW